MDLKTYFDKTNGVGVLSTADKNGKVDTAVYSRPHVFDDNSVAFIMRDRLSHKNLKENSQAAYMFIEEGRGYKGKRFFLNKIREEEDAEIIDEICRRCYTNDKEHGESRYLVVFGIDKELPLIGGV